MNTPEKNEEYLKKIDAHLTRTDQNLINVTNKVTALEKENERIGESYEHILKLNKETNKEIGRINQINAYQSEKIKAHDEHLGSLLFPKKSSWAFLDIFKKKK